ncbi:hypothetical protein EMPS_08918 [Entomortierella parvispora]|uniref:Uncharacterized protein n=1 Tax=Entomortierella parvispora TaxID=205924 RepID=A0A9P3HGZ9_9FUNG|nr:hypothetical protein EMPS_08918 [Entomortierella parvispora]
MFATTNNNANTNAANNGPSSVNGGQGATASGSTNAGGASNAAVQPHAPPTTESYSPWDMPPIVQPASSASGPATDQRLGTGLKGFSSNLNSTWPHFRSKPHPTISVPITPTTLSRSFFDMGAPSTPPRSSTFSTGDDSDNAMCTPTFGSNQTGSRRNSAVSVMALDTPPPLSLMDLESSSSHSGSGFGSSTGMSSGGIGSLARHGDHYYGSNGHGYPFPLFGMRHDTAHPFSRRSSRTNSFSMESRHARKASEDTNMSDGGNNSGSEQRGRRHSPAVTPYDRNAGRATLLPKPKGLLKVFSQLEEEAHHNRHEYDHERETTQAAATRQEPPPLHELGITRRPSTSSRLNPDQELVAFQQQQEEYDKIYRLYSSQHPLQANLPVPEPATTADSSVPSAFASHGSQLLSSLPSSPLLTATVVRSKRKPSTCEDRFDPYHSSHLKRRAVSPSIGPITRSRQSPSSSPARGHLSGQSRSRISALPSPSGSGTFFRHGLGQGHASLVGGLSDSSNTTVHGGPLSLTHPHLSAVSAGPQEDDHSVGSTNGANREPVGNQPLLNLQHTSRSFSELSLGLSKDHPQQQ